MTINGEYISCPKCQHRFDSMLTASYTREDNNTEFQQCPKCKAHTEMSDINFEDFKLAEEVIETRFQKLRERCIKQPRCSDCDIKECYKIWEDYPFMNDCIKGHIPSEWSLGDIEGLVYNIIEREIENGE